ncbi:XshC-Cox1 family protein [Rhodococcus sp. 06-156-3C]|uniref:XdhC family protein n=1 Tax=Nocardiaceae TaxID=85025 RepID=UPI0005230819|nr:MULTISPECIES: XdhC/CoxI family protein [Rhodococcus]OZD12577.1 XshC-Cox1 family protein [Rhodococcus sp. 06-156-4a]OZD18014.1 XshC-Cox1 family protein [Rhodococcus sp. 06-156-3C]OZD20426.1 XshC-Cox1 family protein [Rhodococcus sp. 06-156-4C]OZD29270.1 XshC-Cox1 family protein [Rhodococcus sp. 06-156-3]OZD30542.1 XshC-Cox1 family protein [Rhodococcus sp. 06-156-3b]
MRDIIAGVSDWIDRAEPFAMATIVRTWKSAPRPPGASMAVSQSGHVLGSVSGGCVEGALYETALDVIADGHSRLERYEVNDDDAFSVGLTCGGTIEVLVRRIDSAGADALTRVAQKIASDDSVAIVTDMTIGAHATSSVVTKTTVFGNSSLSANIVDDLRARMKSSESNCYTIDAAEVGGPSLMVEVHNPRPRMIVFGAIDFAAALTRLGALVGYHVTVVDARAVFATQARFPDADEVVVEWPHVFLRTARIETDTVLAVLTHDEKFDLPLLEHALRSEAAYIGALGSRRTHERRVAALLDLGLPLKSLERLHSPIGLDLGARSPDETAVSIVAEIMKTVREASGDELRHLTGPIHRSSLG